MLPHLLGNDRVSLVLFLPVFEPSVIFRLHFGLKHLVHSMVGLDTVDSGILGRVLTLGKDIKGSD